MGRVFQKRIQYDGLTFDSKTEKDRYILLRRLEEDGVISNLELQKSFEIIPQLIRIEAKQLKTKIKYVKRIDERSARYTCDFFYYDNDSNIWVIEEIKSKYTSKFPEYVLRRKLIKWWIYRQNKGANDKQYEFREIIGK